MRSLHSSRSFSRNASTRHSVQTCWRHSTRGDPRSSAVTIPISRNLHSADANDQKRNRKRVILSSSFRHLPPLDREISSFRSHLPRQRRYPGLTHVCALTVHEFTHIFSPFELNSKSSNQLRLQSRGWKEFEGASELYAAESATADEQELTSTRDRWIDIGALMHAGWRAATRSRAAAAADSRHASTRTAADESADRKTWIGCAAASANCERRASERERAASASESGI